MSTESDILRGIRDVPSMTMERERSEFVAYRAGDVSARNRVVESNLRLVAMLANRFSSKEAPFEDLFQAGALALCEAAEKFECEGKRFVTYAIHYVKTAFMGVLRQSTALTFPRRAWSLDDPVGAELLKVLSIDAQSGEVEDEGAEVVLLRDLLEEVREGLPEAEVTERDTREKMARCFHQLTRRQRAALFMRFWEGRLFREIGPTKQAGEQMVSDAVAKLRLLLEEER